MSFVGDEYLKERRASLHEDDLEAESNGELDLPNDRMNTGFFEAISADDFLHCLKVLFLDQILITTVVALYITAPLLGSTRESQDI